MIKEYVCLFKKQNEIKSLRFKIYCNQLTECWSSTIEKSLLQGKNIPKGLLVNFQSETATLNNEILDLICILKKYDKRFNLDWPLAPNEVTRKKLNLLHEQFHFIEEELLENGQAINNEFQIALQLVNDKIHNFEESLENQTKSAKWSLSSFENSVKITNDLRKFWDIKFFKYYKPGTLFLGYHTVGKSLFQCYRSNDVELIKKDGIRQQEFISSEVMFYPDRFIDFNSKPGIKKWLKANNLNVDMLDPKYKYGHHPTLGFLKTDLSKKEITNLFTNWDFFKVDIN
jgi:hypothetical protein